MLLNHKDIYYQNIPGIFGLNRLKRNLEKSLTIIGGHITFSIFMEICWQGGVALTMVTSRPACMIWMEPKPQTR